MPTPAAIKSAFFTVLYSGSAGAAVRAALGAGAASVVERNKINAASLPATPFLALQWGVKGGPRTGVRQYFPTWWIYDSPLHWMTRIEALIPLIEAAYPEDAISMCWLDFLPVREVIDESLGNLPGQGFPFHIKTRG
jgi:hypothetical protein